jgi:hypothetical protein
MPMNPQTGEDLPYKGEPGYEEAKKKFPELYAAEEGGEEAEAPGDEGPEDMMMEEDVEVPEGGVIPDRDLKPLMDKADEILGEEGKEMAEAEEMGAEAADAEAATPMDDEVQPLMETLGMSEERATEIFEAAMAIPQYAEMSGQELADLIASDFQVLMELERMAAKNAKPEAPAPEGGAPMGGPPMGAPMPGGPPGEPTM